MNELLAELNNVDKALIPAPDADPWGDDESPESTRATVGPAIGSTRQIAPQPRPATVAQVGRCDDCGHYVADWHNCLGTVRMVDAPDLGAEYHAWLGEVLAATKGRKAPVANFAEWRDIPSCPGYQMHSRTRELKRLAREICLPNGRPRRYPEEIRKPINGSYSLSVNGRRISRGVNALYRETFPQLFRKTKRKKEIGEWDDTVRVPEEFDRSGNEGVREWLASGGGRIVTRPA